MNFVIENDLSVFDVILKMDVDCALHAIRNFCEREIVRCDQTDCISFEIISNDCFGSSQSILRVCAVEDFIQEKEQRTSFCGNISKLTKTFDLRIKTGSVTLQRI